MSRALAVLIAATLIVVAVLARGAMDDDGGGGGDGRDDPRVTRIVCAEELRAACDALSATGDIEVRIEAVTTTALGCQPSRWPG